jgi:hypothetical protein
MKNTQHITLQKITLLVVSIIQIIFPFVSSFTGEDSEFNSDPQFTPANYAFGIWGLITTLAFGFGIYQLLPNRTNSELHQKIAPKLIVLYVLFCVWLIGAGKEWQIFTVIVFVTMFVLAFLSFQQVLKYQGQFNWVEKILLEAQLGLYTGWCTVAIFVNAGVAIKFYGVSDVGEKGIFWQSLLLLGALANCVYGLYKTNANYFLFATFLWAFVGVYIGLMQESGNTEILKSHDIFAIISLCVELIIIKKYKKNEIHNPLIQ